MLTKYARKEPTTDPITLKYCPETKKQDVVFYSDLDAKTRYMIWRWDANPPTKRNKYVTLNCSKWRLVWI